MIGKIYSPPDISWNRQNSVGDSLSSIFHSVASSPVQWNSRSSPLPFAMPYRSHALSRPSSPQIAPSPVGSDGWIWPGANKRSPSASLRLNNDGTFYHATEVVLLRTPSGFTYARY